MRLNKFLVFLGLILFVAFSASAQTDPDEFINQVNSPYSAYGIGDLVQQGFALNRGLGGTHATLISPFNVNFKNPASYTDILVTSLEIGFHTNASNLGVSNRADKVRTSDTNPTYLAIGFPIAKNLGFGGGVIPISNVGYNVVESSVGDFGEEVNLFEGDGDLYKTFVGLGYSYGTKKSSIAVGLNANYVFGRIERSVSNFILEETSFLRAKNNLKERYSGWDMQYGVRYTHRKTEESDYTFIAGFTGDLGANVNLERIDQWVRTGGGLVEEEITSSEQELDVDLPSRISLGIAIKKAGQWTLSLEGERTSWSSLQGLNNQDVFKDASKISLGYTIIPDGTAFNNYLKTIQYRFGAYYSTGNLLIDNTEISEFALTLGLGLPVRRNSTRLPNFSRLNLSFEVGQRGTIDSGLVQENFLRATFGITLNDKWFVKRKFD